MTNLAWLSLGGNQIGDISLLSNLTNLWLLALHWNQISDIHALSRLTNLTELWLFNNQISDIGVLSSLANLTTLLVQNNQIGDIQAIVANVGLGEGDSVSVYGNSLDLTAGSDDMLDIEALQEGGVNVQYNDPEATFITPFIRDWLVLGAYAFEEGNAESAFATDYVGESNVQPCPKSTAGGKAWESHRSSGDVIDFNSHFTPNEHAVAYGHVYIRSSGKQPAQLRLGSDDAIKAWVNGVLVHSNYINRGAVADQDIVTITLNDGWNQLLVKVLEWTGGWGFLARITDSNGNEVPGLEYSLEKGELCGQ